MLLAEDLPLSPFCVASLRKTLGTTQFKQLCAECDVPWEDVEGVLRRRDFEVREEGRRLDRRPAPRSAPPAPRPPASKEA